MILLRYELKAIGNNFNQLVKKLHTASTDAEIKTWALLNENSKQIFFKKVDEINFKISQIADKWSQEKLLQQLWFYSLLRNYISPE